jgi:hypothetical protein
MQKIWMSRWRKLRVLRTCTQCLNYNMHWMQAARLRLLCGAMSLNSTRRWRRCKIPSSKPPRYAWLACTHLWVCVHSQVCVAGSAGCVYACVCSVRRVCNPRPADGCPFRHILKGFLPNVLKATFPRHGIGTAVDSVVEFIETCSCLDIWWKPGWPSYERCLIR